VVIRCSSVVFSSAAFAAAALVERLQQLGARLLLDRFIELAPSAGATSSLFCVICIVTHVGMVATMSAR
jgi:hypothetical protein